MTQNTDLRIRRTLNNIRDAFLELVIEHGYDSITVQMIAQRAIINRATFYRHYTDKFDLAEQLAGTLTPPEITPENVVAAGGDIVAATRLMLEHSAQYARFYLVAVSANGIPQFRERMLRIIEGGMRQSFRALGVDEKSTPVPFDLAIRYLATAQMGFVEWWLTNEQPFSAEIAAQHLITLTMPVATQALGLTTPH